MGPYWRLSPCLCLILLLGCDDWTERWEGLGESDAEEQAPGGGEVHLVRMTASGNGRLFIPDDLEIGPGDAVRFVLTVPDVRSVAFEADDLSPQARTLLAERSALRGPVLTDPGASYEISFEDAPPGSYPYFVPGQGAPRPHGRIHVRGGDAEVDEPAEP